MTVALTPSERVFLCARATLVVRVHVCLSGRRRVASGKVLCLCGCAPLCCHSHAAAGWNNARGGKAESGKGSHTHPDTIHPHLRVWDICTSHTHTTHTQPSPHPNGIGHTHTHTERPNPPSYRSSPVPLFIMYMHLQSTVCLK